MSKMMFGYADANADADADAAASGNDTKDMRTRQTGNE